MPDVTVTVHDPHGGIAFARERANGINGIMPTRAGRPAAFESDEEYARMQFQTLVDRWANEKLEVEVRAALEKAKAERDA
jgi:hypothetical protein